MRAALFALVLFSCVPARAEQAINYPMGVVSEATEQAGIFNRRQPRRSQPAPNINDQGQPTPPADGNRTAPVDPNKAPQFDSAPADGSGSVLSLAELTPEQKEQLIRAIIGIVSALIGAFGASGRAGPFFSLLLEAFKGALAPPASPATPAKTRKRAKAKPKAATPKV